MYTYALSLLSALWVVAFGQPPATPYQFDAPQLIAELPAELEEISGLSLDRSGRYLIAVEDENGTVYYLDKQTGAIHERFDFWKEGDYEGVEAVGDDIYVVKSTGTLYRIRDVGEASQHTDKYNAFLNDENDVEGLAYDPIHRQLLLACKADGGEGYASERERCIYAFDLLGGQLITRPAFVITRQQIRDYLRDSPREEGHEKLSAMFNRDDEFELSPSALAVHPLSGDLYILSSAGKTMLVLQPGGAVRHIYKLDKDIFLQPEGMCFDHDGSLYIANEGKGGASRLYRLSYQPMAD